MTTEKTIDTLVLFWMVLVSLAFFALFSNAFYQEYESAIHALLGS